MKSIISALFIGYCSLSWAQRPATQAETAEDARVLKILSEAMPHEVDGAPDPAERSFGVSSLTGLTGFYNDMNFATRNVFEHQYTISYQFTKAPEALKEKIDKAKSANDMNYLYALSTCEVEIYVNSTFSMPYSLMPINKISLPYCANAYRNANTTDGGAFLFFGNNWTVKPKNYPAEDVFGQPEKRFTLDVHLKTHPGTDIQGIVVHVKGHNDIAELVMQQIDWQKINSLIGTGKITDDESESDLKKYFIEKETTPLVGNNTLSFTYVAEDGKEKTYAITSSKHDLSNCALLRNRNENPKIMQDAQITFRIQDDKDQNKLFLMALPIIRTTGTVTATFQSDYDYQVMWRGNPDASHSFTATEITITLSKWAPVGDFLEGSFSGTATIKDHNDFTDTLPTYTIKNGKFRIRRIKDEMK